MEGQEDIFLGAEKRFERHMGRCKIGLMQEMGGSASRTRRCVQPASRPASASALRQGHDLFDRMVEEQRVWHTPHPPSKSRR